MSKKSLIVIIATIAVVVVALFAVYTVMGSPVDKNDGKLIFVKINSGSSTGDIALALEEKDLIKSSLFFKLKSRISGKDGKFIAGGYEFKKSESMSTIMKKMINGEIAGKRFRVIEGQTIDKIADQLSKEGVVNKEKFLKVIEKGEFNYRFLEGVPAGPRRLEGFLYPNTYTVPKDATEYDVVDIMLKGFKNAVSGTFEEIKIKGGRSFYEVLIIASIVEREASKTNEKPKVASVIENRLKIDMPLQMDSIISYIHKEDKIRATYKDIAVQSPYNPYTNKGLPPGPISSPGIDAIRAAANPEKTKYLYFVATPKLDGTNVYSEKYEDFLKHKAEFDKAYLKYVKENPGKE